jgi:hypothetical protein
LMRELSLQPNAQKNVCVDLKIIAFVSLQNRIQFTD